MPVPGGGVLQDGVWRVCLCLSLSLAVVAIPLVGWLMEARSNIVEFIGLIELVNSMMKPVAEWLLEAFVWVLPRALFLGGYLLLLAWLTLVFVFIGLRIVGVFHGPPPLHEVFYDEGH
ncbi:Ba03.1 [Baboon cytomegalovirus]|nr:Ba03.1 [Baboon cytomegalovirus]